MNEIISAQRVLILSILFYVLITFIYWGWNQGGTLMMLLASILHIFMIHILVWKFAKSLYVDTRRIFSPVSIFFIMTFFYFSITFLKYFRDPSYPEFTTNIFLRLLGTVLVFLSILILLYWRSLWSVRHPDKIVPVLQKIGEFYGFRIMVFIGCVTAAIGLYFINVVATSHIIKMALLNRSTGIYLLITSSLFFPMLVAALFIKKGTIRNISLNILLITAIAVLVFTGQRTGLMVSILLLLLYNLYKIKTKSNVLIFTTIYLLVVPLIVTAIAVPLTNYVKGGIDKDLVETAERGELSDYAINIASLGNRPNAFSFLNNAFKWAILGNFIDKTRLEYTEVTFQTANQWRIKDLRNGYVRDAIDYPDTVFSCGAYLGGYIGILLFPLIWIGSFSWFINKCSGLLSVVAFLACLIPMCNVELSVWAIIAVWRNYLITTVIMYFIFSFALYLNRIRLVGR